MSGNRDHWERHARQWARVGPPLRPVEADLHGAERALEAALPASGEPAGCGVVLGATPELAGMSWPPSARLLAVDRCPAMIQGVWSGARAPCPAWAVLGDWRRLPVATGRADAVVGDGCYTLLPDKASYEAVTAEVRRVLRPSGRFVMRFFVAPERPEAPEAVFDALERGSIGSFHAFKWRLAMALQGDDPDGVPVAAIWRAWSARGWRPETLSRHLGWPPEAIATIEAYRDSDARYTFPALERVRAHLAPYFREVACHFPPYELGQRCPTLVLAPR